ncbi:VOC family protein [Kocuria nitroreducens]|uniref:VOC family protein n=1 Tax=Kocuria nitroreducens TaxID=3058914 RepID=UPI0036DEAD3C
MKLGYVIVYVPQVAAALEFYRRAFGFDQAFLHESGDYGQLDTGETAVAFTSHALGASAVPVPYTALDPTAPPAGFELTLTTGTVDEDFTRAVDAGAQPLSEPHDEPWGQRVSYVRDPFGVLIGIASPM